MVIHNTFDFTSYRFNGAKREAEFTYSLILKDHELIQFTETLHFPQEFPKNREITSGLFENILFQLHLMLGISYWKLHCLRRITIDTHDLTSEQARFWNLIYHKGLGEFFYQNAIDARGLDIFPADAEEPVHKVVSLPQTQKRALCGIGGGKDSVVAIEELKKRGIEVTGFYVETNGHCGSESEIAALAGIPLIRVVRTLDPQLSALVRTGQARTGHVPISAIYAFIGLLTALIYDYPALVTGNERSADFENTVYLGEPINHQWSKTSEFEAVFNAYVRRFITPSLSYGSILRPYSELYITREFARYPDYFPVFSSCNRTLARNTYDTERWCGTCAKCAFVFVMLAAFIPRTELISFFRSNPLSDRELVPLYRSLLGFGGIKPFDCVGTPEEVRVAMYKIYEKGEFAETPIMQMFASDVLKRGVPFASLEESLLKPARAASFLPF